MLKLHKDRLVRAAILEHIKTAVTRRLQWERRELQEQFADLDSIIDRVVEDMSRGSD